MRYIKFSFLALTLLMLSCTSSQRITSSWTNKEAIPDTPFNTICVIALIPDQTVKLVVEDKMVNLINKRGRKAIKSADLLKSASLEDKQTTKNDLIKLMKDAECDGVLTIAQLDIKTEERYVPGSDPQPLPPFRFRYYGNYNSYYNYRYNQINDPGYTVKEMTYFFETNFYDLGTEDLLWSVQSESFEPTDVKSWFRGYSKLLVNHLKDEQILKK